MKYLIDTLGNKLTNSAEAVLKKRYYLKDKDGKIIENWEGLCNRVSTFVSSEEKDKKYWKDKFFDILYNRRFLPNSPTLMNAGRKEAQLSACFVVPIEDDIISIMDAVKNTALIHKSGGGTGFAFSFLRPKNSIVASTNGVASGPVSFMKMINDVTQQIKQGGTRRGANMGILSVDHPDIEEFINCKQDTSQFTNFNISVAITDKFMRACYNDDDFALIDPHTKKEIKRISAKDLFEKIVRNAWNTGEPGLFFIDKANASNVYGTYYATNPCGEQMLLPYEACNLGSINSVHYVTGGGYDFGKLEEDVQVSVRFLDNIVSLSKYPIDDIKVMHDKSRKIGLGIMGFADSLVMMNIPYGSKDSIDFAEKLYGFIDSKSKEASTLLGEEKGIPEVCKHLNINRRNLYTTTIAPTGTISIIAGCSSGIEPIFSVGYERNIMDNTKLIEINKVFSSMVDVDDKLAEKLCSVPLSEIDGLPKKIYKLFVTSHDVSVENHIKMQDAFQKYCDNGVSKTINLPNSATEKDVLSAFLLAYKLSCKGITIYRDGCRSNQPMSQKKEEVHRKVFNRTTTMSGVTEKIHTSLGTLYLTMNRNAAGDIGEILMQIGHSGSDIQAFCEGVGRLLSIALQHGVPAHKIGNTLKNIKGDNLIIHEGKKYTSILDIIGRKLIASKKEETEIMMETCPQCESKLYKAEGCSVCLSCGFSKC